MRTNIEVERMRQNLSRAELSVCLSVSERTLKRWIIGANSIPASKLRVMARLFNCSVDYLLRDY